MGDNRKYIICNFTIYSKIFINFIIFFINCLNIAKGQLLHHFLQICRLPLCISFYTVFYCASMLYAVVLLYFYTSYALCSLLLYFHVHKNFFKRSDGFAYRTYIGFAFNNITAEHTSQHFSFFKMFCYCH